MKKSYFAAAGKYTVLILGIFLAGCTSPSGEPDLVLPEGGSIEEASSLFVKDADAGTVVFATNDSRYSGQYGYTLWSEEDTVYSPFTHMNMTLSKLSGNSDAGYGVVFCSSDSSMLLVLINVNREYLIGELDGNVFTEISGWTETGDLNGGYNQDNTLDLVYDTSSGGFRLSFNGGEGIIFRDDEEPYHTGGKNGYIVVVSPREDFPEVPVAVTFREN